MRKVKVFAVCLLAVSLSFAADKKGNLGFSQGDNEFSLGALFGWGDGSGWGIPLVWDHGAFNGMLSFGAEFRGWGDSYRPYSGNWWNYGYYNGYPMQNIPYNNGNYDWGREYGYYLSDGLWYPVYRHNHFNDSYYTVDANGVRYSPIDKKFYRFGWSPAFRVMFHPFGMPVLKGKVKIARSFDPYAGMKFGFSVINYDKDDPWHQGDYHRHFDFPIFAPVAGLHWYFKDNVSLWTELARYDFSLGFSFKF